MSHRVESPSNAKLTSAQLIAAELRSLKMNLLKVAWNLEQLSPSEVLQRRGHEVGAMQAQVALLQAAARGLGVKP